MTKEEELFDFIKSVYDAALDPSQWTGIVARCAAFVGSPAACLYSRDALIKSVDVTCQVGLDPQFVRSYADTYTKLDPAVTVTAGKNKKIDQELPVNWIPATG